MQGKNLSPIYDCKRALSFDLHTLIVMYTNSIISWCQGYNEVALQDYEWRAHTLLAWPQTPKLLTHMHVKRIAKMLDGSQFSFRLLE
jgi:hypothetical protein